MRVFFVSIILFAFSSQFVKGQFPPSAGQAGTTAIYKDSSVFVAWANGCEVTRGWQNIADTTLGKADVGDSSVALGAAGANGVVSLGDGGIAVVTFNLPIVNGESWDFAVFENSFSDHFLELAFVEVSSDGKNYIRFPSTSLTDTLTQLGAFDELMDATKINNLAGKYRALYGTPFDLQDLAAVSSLDLNHITHVRIIDVVGSLDPDYASYDAFNHKINDPWPTPFNSSGFDLDAVGVIHQQPAAISENKEESEITVYPNPVCNILYVSSARPNKLMNVSLMNLEGTILKETAVVDPVESLDITDIPSGLYILKICNDNQILYKKILKN
ncbi:MAG TPA: T9SS type A sorting domain-containing protein [Bacteroidales bacterium]|nr:T9SS type A sorting domain-containing protein [Bacteroidales bacterium]